jgi:hypothetical protein
MKANLTMMLAFLAAGCGGATPRPAEHVQAAGPAAPVVEPATPVELPPKQALAKADLLYQSQLGATRGGKFELDRQVTELRQAKLLYEQFVERAAGNPELEPAVRKSRERIVDVQQTIDFLLGEQPPGNEPAPAR